MTRIISLLFLFIVVGAPYVAGMHYTEVYEARTDFTDPVVVILWAIYALWFFYPVIGGLRRSFKYRNVR